MADSPPGQRCCSAFCRPLTRTETRVYLPETARLFAQLRASLCGDPHSCDGDGMAELTAADLARALLSLLSGFAR